MEINFKEVIKYLGDNEITTQDEILSALNKARPDLKSGIVKHRLTGTPSFMSINEMLSGQLSNHFSGAYTVRDAVEECEYVMRNYAY